MRPPSTESPPPPVMPKQSRGREKVIELEVVRLERRLLRVEMRIPRPGHVEYPMPPQLGLGVRWPESHDGSFPNASLQQTRKSKTKRVSTGSDTVRRRHKLRGR